MKTHFVAGTPGVKIRNFVTWRISEDTWSIQPQLISSLLEQHSEMGASQILPAPHPSLFIIISVFMYLVKNQCTVRVLMCVSQWGDTWPTVMKDGQEEEFIKMTGSGSTLLTLVLGDVMLADHWVGVWGWREFHVINIFTLLVNEDHCFLHLFLPDPEIIQLN